MFFPLLLCVFFSTAGTTQTTTTIPTPKTNSIHASPTRTTPLYYIGAFFARPDKPSSPTRTVSFGTFLQNIIRKCPFSSENHKTLKLLNVKIQKFKPSGSSSIRTLALRIPDTHHKHHHPFLLLAARGEVCCLASYARTHTPHTPLRARTHALDRRHDKEVSLC